MNNRHTNTYNPDVLSCLANLSNDEVFTPPDVANKMLDTLPQKLFRDKNSTFLDPACKSGVFLREIAKRLLSGLEDEIPNLEERIDHILHKQIFGIAITEMTSLLARRSVYCSKYPNGSYSVSAFDNAEGNIRFKRGRHNWENERCSFCGASKSEYDRGEVLETHAYEFIHTDKPEGIFDMKFDVVVGNPPYQLDTGGSGRQAKPIYQLFVQQAKKLNPKYLSMIIPSRWFAGGMGLDDFRDEMLNDNHLLNITDYPNAKDCFPENSISGGVCYFLRSRDNVGECTFSSVRNGNVHTLTRRLDEFAVLVRYNEAVEILRKVKFKNEDLLSDIASSLTPFGLPTNYRGENIPSSKNDLKVHTSEGVTFISPNDVEKGCEYLNKYKVLISKTGAEHAGEPGKDGKYRVFTSSMKVLEPNELCTHSYFVIGQFDDSLSAENLLTYLKTRFLRFLVLLSMSSINVSKSVFQFVPIQDFTDSWTDEKLYKKYNLTKDEIAFIESMIRPMEIKEGENV